MVRTAPFCLLIALSLAACGGDEVSTTPPPTESPTTTTAVESSGEVVPIEAPRCGLVTAADVSDATGLTVADGREDGPVTCMYDIGTNTGVSVFVAIEDGQGRFSGAASLYSAYTEEGDEMISGLGQSAVFSQGFRTIAVDAGGGRYIAVGVNGGYSELAEPRDVLVELAAVAVSNL